MQFVVIDSESEDDSDAIPAKAPRAPATLKLVQKSTTIEAKPTKPHPKVAKVERGQNVAVLDTKPKLKPHSGNVKASKLAPAAAVPGPATSNVNNLPEFAISTWGSAFLTALYAGLGSSHTPFLPDADMVKCVQGVVNHAYPDSDYQVRFE